jgi:hypothetical protein
VGLVVEEELVLPQMNPHQMVVMVKLVAVVEVPVLQIVVQVD